MKQNGGVTTVGGEGEEVKRSEEQFIYFFTGISEDNFPFEDVVL